MLKIMFLAFVRPAGPIESVNRDGNVFLSNQHCRMKIHGETEALRRVSRNAGVPQIEETSLMATRGAYNICRRRCQSQLIEECEVNVSNRSFDGNMRRAKAKGQLLELAPIDLRCF